MIKWKNKKFEVQNKADCINYNWSKNKAEHCVITYSESLEKPVNVYCEYKHCCLDNGIACEHYNCGVQLV